MTSDSKDPIVVVAAKRTPIGSFQGQFAGLTAPQLGAAAIAACLPTSTEVHIDEAYVGCVLPAGVGQAPARQAVLGAGLPLSVACTTVNKVCGSGMMAFMLACDRIVAGSAEAVVAAGMESMTNSPYLLPKARQGYRMGHQRTLDHMFFDGLENPYDGELMGHFAEKCADEYAFTREAQDAFAAESVRRAQHAVNTGAFQAEIAGVKIAAKGTERLLTQDETPLACDIDKIPKLKPAFRRDGGTVTAANASSISDGAAALLVMRASTARRRELTPLARVVGSAVHARAPEWFTTAPVGAIDRLQRDIGWRVADVDLYEINEAFAVVTMAAMRDLSIPHEKVNVNGGACALGHPIGATGARLLVTLVHALRNRGLSRGIASLCIGGGEATAVALELV